MPSPDIVERLTAVRRFMAKDKVDILVVRSTDRYLNEYVPTEASARVWISGFTGSMGDAVITADQAFVAVDGRYWLQADKETDAEHWTVVKVPFGTGIARSIADTVAELVSSSSRRKPVVGYEPAKNTPAELKQLQDIVGDKCAYKSLFPSPVERARGAHRSTTSPGIRLVDEKKVGATVRNKLDNLAERLAELDVDALLVQRLDEIAYLANLRGSELPYQATFKAIALATPETLFVGIDPSTVPSDVRVRREHVMFVPEAELWGLIGKKAKRKRVGYDRSQNSELGRERIEDTGAKAVLVTSPIGPMKATKNKAEITAMTAAFARADLVVDQAQRWLCDRVVAGERVTESAFADKVSELFTASGAVGLSFRIISAAGKNGAIIHYSDPSHRRAIKRGELMLLDTGAYYAEGYATDLTRTFLVDGAKGKGDDKQRYYYTTVLKSAIAGMSAVLPVGAKGYQLDAITRAPLWAEGLDFNHGTGHGVGVNVHEFPPRIGPSASAELEEGFVFSIEPGVYMPKFGGVRIENLCTLVKAKGRKGYLAVQPLTFSPLDNRLIDKSRLTAEEKAWLTTFSKVHASPSRKRLQR